METAFTPFASLAGGVLIGIAAVLLMTFHGRIAGMTGILTGALLPADRDDWTWRAAFIAGAVLAPIVYLVATGAMPDLQVPVTRTMLVVGGLLVGIGVTVGAGCTSGHGVCGLARLSPRSLVATITFMLATGLTVFILRHVIGG